MGKLRVPLVGRIFEIGFYASVGVLCLTVILFARRQHETETPAVYDAVCKGVSASDPKERIRWLTRAMAIDPDYARSYKDRATAHLEMGQIDPAIRDCTRAVELNPDYSAAYQTRAVAHRAKKDFDKMRTDVERCRQLGGYVDPRLLGADG